MMASASTNPANQPRAKRTRRLKASGTRIDGLELRMPALVDEDLLLSQVAILPGSQDIHGCDVIIFRPSHMDRLLNHFTPAHIVVLLQYYVTLAQDARRYRNAPVLKSIGPGGIPQPMRASLTNNGVAILADLSRYTKEGLLKITDAFDRIEAEKPGSISTFYCIQPKNKQLVTSLKKMTGLKASKKYHNKHTYMTVLLDKVQNLPSVIRKEELTEEFGGSLTYKHETWIEFVKMMSEVEATVEASLKKVPSAIDHLSMTLEYDLTYGPDEQETRQRVEELALKIRNKYNNIMRELNMEHVIDECQQILSKVSDPKAHPPYNEIKHSHVLACSQQCLKHYSSTLIKARERLTQLWNRSEGKVLHVNKVLRYKDKATKIWHWLDTVGLPMVKQNADIADSLGDAEIVKNHYETGFYSLAQKVLALAASVQHKLDGVFASKQVIPDQLKLIRFCRDFQAKLEFFRQGCETKRQVYISVYNYFTTSNKIHQWYQEALRFLPLQLLTFVSDYQVSGTAGLTAAWHSAIEDYLLANPAPKLNELKSLQEMIPKLEGFHLRNQTRMLLSRIFSLRQFLIEPHNVEPIILKNILLWQHQVTSGQDDIALSLKDTNIELSDEKVASAKSKNRSQGSVVHHDQNITTSTGASQPRSMYVPKLRSPATSTSQNTHLSSLGPTSESVSPAETDTVSSLAQKPAIRIDFAYSDDEEVVTPCGRHPSPLPVSGHHVELSDFSSHGTYKGPAAADCDSGVTDTSYAFAQQERYVSLGDAGVDSLPESLSHLNLDALCKNRPQIGELSTTSPTLRTHNRDHYRDHSHRATVKNNFLSLDLDDIATSSLTPEKKIGLMAAICAENHTSPDDCTDIPHRGDTPVHSVSQNSELSGAFADWVIANEPNLLSQYLKQKQDDRNALTIHNVQLQSVESNAPEDVSNVYRSQHASVRSTGSGIDIQAWVNGQISDDLTKNAGDSEHAMQSEETKKQQLTRRRREAEDATLASIHRNLVAAFVEEEVKQDEVQRSLKNTEHTLNELQHMNDTLFSDTVCAPPLEGVHDDSFESGFYTYSGTDVPNKSTPKHYNKGLSKELSTHEDLDCITKL